MSQASGSENKAAGVGTEWDLSTIFSSEEEWEEAYQKLSDAIPGLSSYKGLNERKAEELYAILQKIDHLKCRLEILYVYAQLRYDLNSGEAQNQALYSRAVDLVTHFSAALAFFEPELSQIDQKAWDKLEADCAQLKLYHEYHRRLTALQEHILSDREEALLSEAAPILGNSGRIFGLLNNTDFTFPDVQNEKGETVKLTHGSFQGLLQSPAPEVRRAAFEAYYSVYQQFNNSLAGILSGAIQKNNFLAKARHYPSARAKSLYENQIPEGVYDQLIKTVRERIDLLHRYTALRKKMLGLEHMYCSDFYAPMVTSVSIRPDYQAGKELVLSALEVMGADYVAIVERAFAEGWIDVYEKKGKRSGAYSGGSFGTNPFILLNWQDQLSSVYTLIHELGHSVHSYYSRQSQPYVYADYPIFLAEIASTTNENILTDYLLKKADDPVIKASILAHYLDGFKATVFRQTQFAEFEHMIHEADREGRPLTADFLNKTYKALNDDYYGPALADDPLIAYEWSRIPHFYYNYYVYQYATGFSAATAFARGIQESDEKRQAYLDFLKAGSSAPPIEILKKAGLDMTKAEPIHKALDVFSGYLDQLEQYAGFSSASDSVNDKGQLY